MEGKRDYQISVSMNEDIAEIVFTGDITEEDVGNLHNEVIAILKEKHARALLCDITELKGRPEKFAEAYFRVRSFPKDVKIMPSAIIDPIENEAYKSFYTTTAANVGQTVKWFTNIQEARAWLKGKIKAP